MSPTSPPGPQQAPTGQNTAGTSPSLDQDARRRYARWIGWLILVLIVGYAGLQMPLPWRFVTIAAALVGIGGGIALIVQCIRRRIWGLTCISAVLVTLCCSFFLLTAGMQVIFWEASVTFHDCLSAAVTDRAEQRCYTQYENDITSSIPGMP